MASVLQQNYEDFEIVVVDNCSSDQTAAIVTELSEQFGMIRFFKNPRNLGLAGNLNKCLDCARGEYIKYLCVDDLLLPDCLLKMVTGLEMNPEVSLVCGGRLSLNEAGQAFGTRHYSSSRAVISGRKAISRCLFGGNFIGEPTAVMFRKADAHVRFRDDLPQLMDMEMWFRLLEKGDLLNIETSVCGIRFHEAQMTQENIKLGHLIGDNVRILSEFLKKPYLEVTKWSMIRLKLLMTYRVWVSRKYISGKKRSNVLREYGIRALYPFAPMAYYGVFLKRKLMKRNG